MKTSDLIARTQEVLGLESRAELEHVLTCTDCYLFNQIDCGPFWCLAFRTEFRGYVPREQPSVVGEQVMEPWGPLLTAAITTTPRFGSPS